MSQDDKKIFAVVSAILGVVILGVVLAFWIDGRKHPDSVSGNENRLAESTVENHDQVINDYSSGNVDYNAVPVQSTDADIDYTISNEGESYPNSEIADDNRNQALDTESNSAVETVNENPAQTATPTSTQTTASTPTPTVAPTPTNTPDPTKSPTATATETPSKGEFIVTFIDVGQGDAILIQDKGSVMMIDTGPKDSVDKIETVLNQYDIETIDAIILSHNDADHIQGSVNLMQDYKVSALYMSDYEKPTGTFGLVMETAGKFNVPIYYLKAGETINFGTAKYEVIGPIVDEGIQYTDSNSYSIVLKVTNGSDSFLFMGDAPGEETDNIIKAGYNVKANVYKAAHHGSAQSGCNNDGFLNSVSPDFMVVSCELYNRHGHPHGEPLEWAKKNGCALFRTDIQGTITCISTGKGVQWDKEPTDNYTRGQEMK